MALGAVSSVELRKPCFYPSAQRPKLITVPWHPTTIVSAKRGPVAAVWRSLEGNAANRVPESR